MDKDRNQNNSKNHNVENKFDGFVESIEEEIRNENWQKLWDKYGKVITYVSCVIIASAGVYNMWQRQELAEREAISSRYTFVQNSIMSGNSGSILSEIKQLSNVDKKDYAVLAKLEYAAMLLSEKNKLALDEYKSISQDHKANKILRDLAYIFYVNASIDLLPAKEISSLLNGFIEKLNKKYIGKKWDILAKESLAFCYMKDGNNEKAKETLNALAKTPGIPKNMLERVGILLHTIE